MGVGLADTARQRGIRPHLDARFAQGLRPAAADETVGFVQREDHAGEAVAQDQLASCSAWCVGEVSWVWPVNVRPSGSTTTAPTQ